MIWGQSAIPEGNGRDQCPIPLGNSKTKASFDLGCELWAESPAAGENQRPKVQGPCSGEVTLRQTLCHLKPTMEKPIMGKLGQHLDPCLVGT